MKAFFCATPYQIMIAMHLSMEGDADSDLYVINHFNNAKEITRRLEDLKIFNKIELVDSIEFLSQFSLNKILRYIEKTITFLKYKEIVTKYFNIVNFYDEVYYSYPDEIIQLAVKFIRKKNSKVRIFLFEDGTGGYNGNLLKTTKMKKTVQRLLGIDRGSKHYSGILLFEPSFYISETSIPLKAIKKIKPSDIRLKNSLNNIFEYSNNGLISQKYIFLEQPSAFSELNSAIYNVISDIFNQNKDLIVKLHPRSPNSDLYSNFKKYSRLSLPWEIISLNNDIQSKVLISYYSTACLTNKIIFNQEPYIIFLYNLKELPNKKIMTVENLQLVNKLKDSYKNKERILIPNNLVEFRKMIIQLNKI